MLLRIREWRHRAGMTQAQLAAACGLHRGHLSSLERGRYSASVDDLEAIAAALDLRVSDLLDERCPVCPYRQKPPPGPDGDEPEACPDHAPAPVIDLAAVKAHTQAVQAYNQRLRRVLLRLGTSASLLLLGLT